MKENQFVDKKSLSIVVGKNADWKELAKDCVCFANSRGGKIIIGIENNESLPPAGQIIDENLPLYSPTIHFLKFDERGQKVNKLLWEDYSLNPKELIEAIWTEIPDWKEGVDVADGMFRKFVPNYEEEVIRELMANALVHRPYTMRGDIFLNLYPDKLEVVNPGLFPIGVTPKNILHKNVRRNPCLAQVFYDLHLMDKEGSGIDKMYQVLLSNAKQIPVSFQGDDYVMFTITRRISKSEIISLMNRANEEFQLNSKELISLGLIAQHNSLSALEFSKELNLPDQHNVVNNWLGRLSDVGLIISKGKTKGTEYLINPDFLKKANFKGKTNLKRIENHRLEELIYQDIKIYQPTAISEIQERIGKEISKNKIQKSLKKMCGKEILYSEGVLKGTKYFIRQNG
ncbi:MAG: putative DNA binding domain-containing protein [Bacteroidia bacterium]|nr:putative DNA binding domain-containing protein [Bacteroidia bacterium]